MQPGSSQVDWDEIPLDPETIKRHIVVRREAIAVMMREIAVLRENLTKKIGPAAAIAWMQAQSAATDDILRVDPHPKETPNATP